MLLADAIKLLVGNDIPLAIQCYDGSRLGPEDAASKIIVRSPRALRHMVWSPGELGIARAYVAGDLDFEGSIFDLFALRDKLPNPKLGPREWIAFLRILGLKGLKKPKRPPEEVVLHGRRHSAYRDKAAITHHYNVSNEFYELVLGPTMTYSCAVWSTQETTLEQAQTEKYDLICRKLDLKPGMRLLDVGCGWGSMAIHAAKTYGVNVVGVTISQDQADFANARVVREGLAGKVEIRVQDYRDIIDGPFDSISSIGMFEHVGEAKLMEYFDRLTSLLAPQGRLLNHGITRAPGSRARLASKSFVNRFVFPDGELHEIGSVITTIQHSHLEVRHDENFREHYNRTLRAWVSNLENNWDSAVELVGLPRAKIWLLYMAGSAALFSVNQIQLHQVLAVKDKNGESGMPPRPTWGA